MYFIVENWIFQSSFRKNFIQVNMFQKDGFCHLWPTENGYYSFFKTPLPYFPFAPFHNNTFSQFSVFE